MSLIRMRMKNSDKVEQEIQQGLTRKFNKRESNKRRSNRKIKRDDLTR